MKQVPENRQYPRRTTYIIAEYTILEGTFRDIIKDLSAGGLFIKTDRKVSVGQPITVKFPLFNFDQIVESVGTVVRLAPDGFAVAFYEPIEGLVCEEGQFPKIIHESDRPS